MNSEEEKGGKGEEEKGGGKGEEELPNVIRLKRGESKHYWYIINIIYKYM